jgi:hypothetical protein
VPFLLTTRHNLEAAKDHFAANDAVLCTAARVRVGAGAECEHVVDEEGFPALAFTVVSVGSKLRLEPAKGVELFVNGETATPGGELLSGDEIRLGHWTCHVHKCYGDGTTLRRRNGLAMLARVLVALILVAELSVVVWLPRQVSAATRRGTQLIRLRTSSLLDALRQRVRTKEQADGTASDEVVQAARAAIAKDLDRRARYLRDYQADLSAEQCQRMHEELLAIEDTLDELKQEGLLRPIPPVDVDAAVKAALQRGGKGAETP